MNILNATLRELSTALQNKQISSKELTAFYLDRIAKYDGDVKSYVHVNEKALEQASAIDDKRAKGEELPLFAGIPLAFKDLIITDDMPTTCSSRILENFRAPFNSTVTDLVRKQGMIILGKLNMDEFAMGSSTETSYFKKTCNPWDLSRVPGGSSGGSAASVAAGLAPITLGSDTGGSIRQPASHCGIVGFKPTYGVVSRFGIVAYASSLDQVGTFTRHVSDSADMLSIIAEHDPKDSTSAPIAKRDFSKDLTGDVKGLRIGIPAEFFAEGLSPIVKERVETAIGKLKELGCEIVEISMPHTEYAVPVYYVLSTAEASSNLARFDGVRFGYRSDQSSLYDMYATSRSEGFGEEVKRRIILGTYVLSAGYYDAYYIKAQKVRTLIKQDFEKAFEKVDAIVSPTSPSTAFKFGEKSANPLEMYLSDINTISLNLYGGCGLSVPCGFDDKGLPVGMQILGKHFEEGKILNIAYAYQQATGGTIDLPEGFKG